MRIVYVLSSDKSDYFYDELLLSVYSLRRHDKNSEVIVLCDNCTYKTLKNKRSAIHDEASVIPVETPSRYNKMQRSRYIKTMVRELIDGDYIFIDIDTIVCQDLSTFEPYVKNIGAVYDCHKANNEYDYSFLSANELKESSSISSYNSGVLIVHDTDDARKLYKEWHRIWMERCERGLDRDQAALRMAQHACGVELEKIDDTWNCMISAPNEAYLLYLNDAKIIHFFHTLSLASIISVLDIIKSTGYVGHELDTFIDSPYRWYINNKEEITITDLMFLQTPIAQVCYNMPNASYFLQRFAQWYERLWTTMSRVKRKIWH